MATTENEYYLRVILLLAEGGVYILKAILYREIQKKTESNLDQELRKFEVKINKEFHWRQVEKLLPVPSGTTNVDKWDVQMLFGVLLLLFRFDLPQDEKKDIQVLRFIRNQVQAHASSASLDKDDFDDYYAQLTDAIACLASKFDQQIQDKCDSFIKAFSTGPLDVKSSIERLKELQDTDDLFHEVLKAVQRSQSHLTQKLTDSENRLAQKIDDTQRNISTTIKAENENLQKELIEKIKAELDRGRCKRIRTVLNSKLTFRGEDQRLVECADKIVGNIINKAITKSDSKDMAEIIKSVDDILEDIESIDGCKVLGAVNSCVLMSIRCEHYKSLLDVLTYFESTAYKMRIDTLSVVICSKYGKHKSLDLTSTIPAECLQLLLEELNQTSAVHGRSLTIPIMCSTRGDVAHLCDLFESGEMTNSVNHVADALSKHLGKLISIQASLDITDVRRDESDVRGTYTTDQITCFIRKHTAERDIREIKTDRSYPAEKTCITFRDWFVLKNALPFFQFAENEIVQISFHLYAHRYIDNEQLFSLHQRHIERRSRRMLYIMLRTLSFDDFVMSLFEIGKTNAAERLLQERYRCGISAYIPVTSISDTLLLLWRQLEELILMDLMYLENISDIIMRQHKLLVDHLYGCDLVAKRVSNAYSNTVLVTFGRTFRILKDRFQDMCTVDNFKVLKWPNVFNTEEKLFMALICIKKKFM